MTTSLNEQARELLKRLARDYDDQCKLGEQATPLDLLDIAHEAGSTAIQLAFEVDRLDAERKSRRLQIEDSMIAEGKTTATYAKERSTETADYRLLVSELRELVALRDRATMLREHSETRARLVALTADRSQIAEIVGVTRG